VGEIGDAWARHLAARGLGAADAEAEHRAFVAGARCVLEQVVLAARTVAHDGRPADEAARAIAEIHRELTEEMTDAAARCGGEEVH
jgi:hypothetical protein